MKKPVINLAYKKFLLDEISEKLWAARTEHKDCKRISSESYMTGMMWGEIETLEWLRELINS